MKKKPIILDGATIDPRPFGPMFKIKTKVEFVGNKGNAYLRLEDQGGRYLGAFDGKDLRRLKK